MKVKYIVYIFLIGNLALISCKKKSSKWLTGEIHVVDADSKEPVKANFELEYYAGTNLGSYKEYETLGQSDENGFFEFEKEIHRKDQEFILKVKAFGYYGYYPGYPTKTVELSKYSHNELTIEVAPLYVMNLSFTNLSCFDDTDTVWVNRIANPEYPQVYTGCLNAYKPSDIYYWSNDDTITYRSISKRDGVYDTLFHSYTMLKGVNNDFVLNY